MTNQSSANETYREFIDGLVDMVPSITGTMIYQQGIASKAQGDEGANEMVSRLSVADRSTLTKMLDAERAAAFHDVLANLTWWLDTGRIRWSAGEEPMPAGLEGGLHCDFVGRLEGWEWPD